jgi:two-component system LytT family response regulator
MIKAVIIDDEENGRELTLNLLKLYCPEVEVLGTGSSVQSGHACILQHRPALVFLDIQMRDGSGFDLLDLFPEIDFRIIFITAYQEFAVQAFKRCALDYLLKPLSPADLVVSIKKAGDLQGPTEWNTQLKTLLGNIREPAVGRRKLVLRTMDRIYSVDVSEIVRFQSEGSYTEVYLKDRKKIVVSRLIKEFDELLSTEGFIRIHQSHLINLDFVFCFEKADNRVVMKDDSQVPVSVRKKETVLHLLNFQ